MLALSIALTLGACASVLGSLPEIFEADDAEGDWNAECIGDPAEEGPEGMDITNVRVEAEGDDTCVIIDFKGDNEMWMAENDVAASGISINVTITAEGGERFESHSRYEGGWKVIDSKLSIMTSYENDGTRLKIVLGGIHPSQVAELFAEAMRYDTYVGSFCDSITLVNE